MADSEFHPVRFAMDKLFALDAPYQPREIVVVLAIVRHMNAATRSCFPAYDRIARQTRVSRRDISRILERHCQESPKPLLARRFEGTRKSYTYELVLDPDGFAVARDAQPKRPKRVRKVAPKKKGGVLVVPATKRALPSPVVQARRVRADRPHLMQCNCGAAIAQWPDGRVHNMVGITLTTEDHICAGVPNGLTNTCLDVSADVPNGPTNTSSDESGDVAGEGAVA